MKSKVCVLATLLLLATAADADDLGAWAEIEVPDKLRVIDFSVTDAGLFFVTLDAGPEGFERRLFFQGNDDSRPQAFDGEPAFLMKTASGVVAYDERTATMVSLSLDGTQRQSRPSVQLAELVELYDGSYVGLGNTSGIARDLSRHPHSTGALESRLRSLGDDMQTLLSRLRGESAALIQFDVFHVTPELSLAEGILKTHRSQRPPSHEYTEEDRMDDWLHERHLRIAPDRRRVVVFKRHLPEIILLQREGTAWSMRDVPASTTGTAVTEDTAKTLGLPYPTTIRLLYQSDIVVRSSSMLIADPASESILSIGDDGTTLARYPVDSVIAEMETNAGSLYVRLRDGSIRRYALPPEPQ